MKLNIKIAVIAASFFGTCGIINATPISWTDTDEVPNFLAEDSWLHKQSYSNTWNLLEHGFTIGNSINGITVTFGFADDETGILFPDGVGGDDEEFVAISLSVPGTQIGVPFQVDGTFGNYAYYSLVLDPAQHEAIFNDLAADGNLTYTVTLKESLSDLWKDREDTWLKVAKIEASYTAPTPNSVPDGGTSVALLGMSLIGIAGLRGKFARANKA